jgi:hypothetical protein
MLLHSCGEGLAPLNDKGSGPGFIKGTIRYVNGRNGWNDSKDSLIAVRAAAFTVYPLPDSAGIINELLAGRAYVSGLETLPIRVDSAQYIISITQSPVLIRYIAIALQYTSDLNSQRVIGVYSTAGDNKQPSPLYVPAGDTVTADITVDFNNLPPQPF